MTASTIGTKSGYWPANKDGTTYFPENHRLLKETDHSKIVDVFIRKASQEPPHTHDFLSVMFVDHPTPLKVREVAENGSEKIVFVKDSCEKSQELGIDHMPPEPFHYVENTSSSDDYRAVRIEFKKRASEGQQASFSGAEQLSNITPSDKPYTLWSVIVPGKKSVSLSTNNFEGVLVGNVKTAFKVHQLLSDQATLLSPFKLDGKERLSVWYLPSDQNFKIENAVEETKTVYFLQIPNR